MAQAFATHTGSMDHHSIGHAVGSRSASGQATNELTADTPTTGVLIERLFPAKATSLGLVAWGLLLIAAPVSARWPQDTYPLLLFCLCTVFLYLGFLAPGLARYEPAQSRMTVASFNRAYTISLLLAALGFAARAADLFIYRGVTIGADFLENRGALVEAQASPFSAAASFLFPFIMATALMSAMAVRAGFHKRLDRLAFGLAIAGTLLPVLLGSRSVIFLTVVQVLVAAVLLMPKIRMQHVVAVLLGGTLLVMAFATIFAMRLEEMGLDYRYSIRYSAFAHVVPASESYLAVLDAAEPAIGMAMTAYASIVQYFLSGVFEFFYLVELKNDNFSMGNYQFFFFSKAITVFFGGQERQALYHLFLENPRAGVFQSLYGPAYIDFGMFCFVFCFFIGLFTELLRRWMRAGSMFLMPAYVYMLATLLILPSVSGLVMAGGMITMFVYVCFAVMASFIRRFERSA